METKSMFLQLQHVCQILLSIYGFRHSYAAITNLQKYEETTKKAAKWSQEVQNQLTKTRTTQATGLITIIISFLSATLLLLNPSFLHEVKFRDAEWAFYSISPATLVIVMGARGYIKNFWTPTKDDRGKDVGAKVPLLPSMEDYNLAVQKTEDLLQVLEYLEYSWLITGFFTFMAARPK